MDPGLLQTKLNIPQLHPAGLVPRPRLTDGLNEVLRRKLCRVTAAAGFGKTTPVSHWLADLRTRHEAAPDPGLQKVDVAWRSLDSGDNDLTRFLAYLIAAVQQVDPQIG